MHLPPAALDCALGRASPRTRPQTPPSEVAATSLLRVAPPSHSPKAPRGAEAAGFGDDDGMRHRRTRSGGEIATPPPLSPGHHPRQIAAATADSGLQSRDASRGDGGFVTTEEYWPVLEMRPVRPNFVRHLHSSDEASGSVRPAPASLLPTLARPEYYCKPSVQKMATMSEAQLSKVDNLEVGRPGFGSIMWTGLTDVRKLDFDATITIDRGSVSLYPAGDKPAIGMGLNKEAVVSLCIRPTRADGGGTKDPDKWAKRMREITESFGNTFISYDLETWIFKVPHFEGTDDN